MWIDLKLSTCAYSVTHSVEVRSAALCLGHVESEVVPRVWDRPVISELSLAFPGSMLEMTLGER